MKTFLLLSLSCISVAASDTGIRFTSSTNTDTATTGAIIIVETYTRGGQTNLIRTTKSKNGVVLFRNHRFCHFGKPVAFYTWQPDFGSNFTVVRGTPYEVGLDFLPSKDVRAVMIWGTNFLDGFYFTNGVFYPVPDSDLEFKDVR